LVQKTKVKIDEILFVHYLYKETKKSLIRTYRQRVEQAQADLEASSDPDEIKKIEIRIADYEKLKAICNICVFYCISYYYTFKSEFFWM